MDKVSPLWSGLSVGLKYETKTDGVYYYFNRFSKDGDHLYKSTLQGPFSDRVDAGLDFSKRYPEQAQKLAAEIDAITTGDFR